MRARSLTQWANQISNDKQEYQVKTFSTLESGSSAYRFGVELYNLIQKKAPWFHHIYFNYLEQAQMHRYADALQHTQPFIDQLEAFQPDIIVSVHAHLNHGYFALAKQILGPQILCVTYCGELFGGYGFSQWWANPDADYFYGAVPACTQQARDLGCLNRKSHSAGFLLHPDFYNKLSNSELTRFQQKIGINPKRFRLILATGANAANNHLKILTALEKKRLPIQVVVLCGKSKQTLDDVEEFAKTTNYLEILPVSYFTEMANLMRSASAIIARPGTGTTSEAIMANCPIIFNGMGGIMPQEWITVKYARSQGFGNYFLQASSCAKMVKVLYEQGGELSRQKIKMKSAVPSLTPHDLFDHLRSMARR